MALDELLLEHVRSQEEPILVVRTYQWVMPTLSLGVHQANRDMNKLFQLYGLDASLYRQCWDLVRRPTGGRAILHGEDLAFSFITNMSAYLRLSLHESYGLLMAFVQQALASAGHVVLSSDEHSGKAYLRSAVCFETQTPSDLVDPTGKKRVGSAQLRRQGGILQHGSIFYSPKEYPVAELTPLLFQAVQAAYATTPMVAFPTDTLALTERVHAYNKESGEIVAKACTTAGSHFVPAS